jgi:isoamylase
MPRFGVESGSPERLGATCDSTGTNFALFSAHAEKVELCLFDEAGAREVVRLAMPARDRDIWHGYVPGIVPGQRYGYRVYGPYDPSRGHRFNPHKLLIDPHARQLDRPAITDERHFAYRDQGGRGFDERDSADVTPKCMVAHPSLPPAGARPDIPWRDTVLYELHIRGMTMRHDGIPARLRGTFGGLASRPVITHLRELGVTSVELMPVCAMADEPRLRKLGLRNYWGYNPVSFFALEPRYAVADPLGEFRALVEAFHDAGLEVIADMVFNHTAEGDALGPTLSFRGIDNASYYWLPADDPAGYVNHAGCGNTLNIRHGQVRALILDALRYGASLGIDGFRFDLASVLARSESGCRPQSGLMAEIAADPILSRLKLVAEPWDASPDGYCLGAFPPPWREWNDRFRDTVRRFWRGDQAQVVDLASRLAGSSDIMASRGPLASINIVTAHDGFTLHDLVSYSQKHNGENGEGNADGANESHSWNRGVEGPTDDPAILRARYRDKRNLIATLLLSQGVPMIAGGDELGRTQNGNNNAYCQDNETSWLDWRTLAEDDAAFLSFVRRVAGLRRDHPALRRTAFFTGLPAAGGRKDISWLHLSRREMTAEDWQDPQLTSFGCSFGEDERFLLLLNAGADPVVFSVPEQAGGPWACVLDTTREDGRHDAELSGEQTWLLAASSLVLFREARA